MLDDAGIQPEAGGLQAVTGSGMAGIQDRHIVFFRHGVDRRKEGAKILFRVDVLFPVGGQQNIFLRLKPQLIQHRAGLDVRQVLMQHLRHRRAGYIDPLLRQPAFVQILARVLRIGQVHVGDDVHDPPVGFFRQAFVLAAVARLHMENRDMQALGRNGGQAAVGVAQDQQGVGPDLRHQLVGAGDDVADGGTQIVPHRIHIHLRCVQLQIVKEHAVQVIIVVLSGVGEDTVKIFPALFDHRRQPNDLRAGAHDDQQLQFAVVLKMDFRVIRLYLPVGHGTASYCAFYPSTFSKKVSGRPGSKGSFAHITVTRFSVSDRLMMLWV